MDLFILPPWLLTPLPFMGRLDFWLSLNPLAASPSGLQHAAPTSQELWPCGESGGAEWGWVGGLTIGVHALKWIWSGSGRKKKEHNGLHLSLLAEWDESGPETDLEMKILVLHVV